MKSMHFSKFGLPVILLSGLTSPSYANEAEQSFVKELASCAAYYEIASTAIASMNAPQMQVVGKRLQKSGIQATEIASQYSEKAQVQKVVAAEKLKQEQALNGSSNLGVLMRQYKEPCKQILAEPQKRLDYWVMVTM
ncbi:hypothetical protein [Shewanella gelidii]|uniref:Uncharacterized protein n=1 Tax=Shewanella gelidii TaxID=1642821 RepID=A0A917JSP5_9GAMM|nr:hypothetical protein [Shewanella gelidii]MCL1098348.1 hypothetical protein [Shewanella gelidii]GGI84542.1 hypothetical protein GCM10009332_22290 [Shewanella gelidii]